jgi:hypothetical protein
MIDVILKDEDTKVPGSCMTCPNLHRKEMTKQGF